MDSSTGSQCGKNKPSACSTGKPTTAPGSSSVNQGGHPVKIALKFLVSNRIAGSIIGRAGSTISELQTLSGCTIKLSQSGECFPGTNERVCLIQGNTNLVKSGIDLILHRFILINDDEESDTVNDQEDENTGDKAVMDSNTNYQMSILIPSSACGLLIGRSGNHIKSISSASQTRIQLGQKEGISSIATSERIFSISGGKENVAQCVDILLDCIEKEMEEVGGVEENSVWRYLNMTTGYNKAVAERGSRGSSFGGQVILPRDAPEKVLDRTLVRQGSGLLHSPHQAIGGQLSSPIPHVFTGQRESGRIVNQSSSTNKSTCIDFISLPASEASVASIAHAAAQMQLFPTSQLYKVEESAQSADKLLSSDSYSITLAIPDPLIGSIIGHNGSTLTQLQLCSQTRIQISQRGDHVPGTNSRIVKITGNTKENCDAAQFWIGQRIVMAQEGLDSGGQGKKNIGRSGGNNRGKKPSRERGIEGDETN